MAKRATGKTRSRKSSAKNSHAKKSTGAGAKPRGASTARGLELVEQVIARIERDGGVLGGCGIPAHRASGLPAEQVIAGTYTDGFGHPIYGPMLEQQARRNFGGFKSFDMGGGDTEHLDGEAAVQAMWAQLAGDAGIDPTTGEPM